MSHLAPSTSSLGFTETGQGITNGEFQRQSQHTASIHILDDDSLLTIFLLYRPPIFDGDEGSGVRLIGGRGWDRERWWYKLAQVCQRWRTLILGSSSYLSLCLVCTSGTPVADMLAHSPLLPLVIDFETSRAITTEDEEGIVLALGQHDRVCRIRLVLPVPSLQKIIMAIDEEYPVLEYLIIMPSTGDQSSALMFSETLQAPHLLHLMLTGFVLPITSQLLTTAVGLVTLAISVGRPSSTYFPPNALLRWVSFMPQLETLQINSFPIPNRDVERQLMQTPIMAHVTLPNLRRLKFQGVSTYMETVFCQITTPRLKKLDIWFFEQLTLSVPRLLRFIHTAENLGFNSVKFQFSGKRVRVQLYHRVATATKYALPVSMNVPCWHLDWQVSSVAQIFNSPSQIFSSVEHLALEHTVHSQSSEEHDEVGRTEWRKLLKSFNNAKTLRVPDGLVKELSRCLLPDDGELPLELLPELQELEYSGSDDVSGAFTPFIDARKNAGRPVALILG